MLRSVRIRALVVVLLSSGLFAGTSRADVLTPSDVYANTFHVTAQNGADGVLPDNQRGAFRVATNGIVDHGTGNGQVDGFDTWQSDNTGVHSDFVGLGYDFPATFDTLTIELGNQFVDGGDWEEMPKVYILKNPVMNSESVRPEISPNWVEVGATLFAQGGETLHEFDPIVIQGEGGTIRLALTGSAEERTGWGWAVGGVDGNERDDGIFNFVSITELTAEGVPAAAAPAIPLPASPQPMNIVSNAYHSPNHREEDLTDGRGEAFEAITNGEITPDGPDGYDTWESDTNGNRTDFVGLQYNSLVEFETISIELGHQFGDGGDWEELPKVYILKNPVDTNRTRPETDPENWQEVAAVETTGHLFETLVAPGAGDSMAFTLTGTAAERTGWGWAVGGVDGNQREDGLFNFISITEVLATGTVVADMGLRGDFNHNGQLDANDLDLLAQAQLDNDAALDLTSDGQTNYSDRVHWLHELKKTWVGDSNMDGLFNSSDFVQVFQSGKFETGTPATWEEGDWDGDLRFATSDFVAAFQDGGFEQGPVAAVSSVPEPCAALLLLLGAGLCGGHRRRA
jgi:hypothetical protein